MLPWLRKGGTESQVGSSGFLHARHMRRSAIGWLLIVVRLQPLQRLHTCSTRMHCRQTGKIVPRKAYQLSPCANELHCHGRI